MDLWPRPTPAISRSRLPNRVASVPCAAHPATPAPLPCLVSGRQSLGLKGAAAGEKGKNAPPPHLLVLQSSVQQRDESQALPGVYWRSGPTTEEQMGPMPPCPWSQPSGTQGVWLSVVPLHFLLCYLREVRP